MMHEILAVALLFLVGWFLGPWIMCVYHQGRRFEAISKIQSDAARGAWRSVLVRNKSNKF